jgi:hypothetical protein
MVLEASLSRLMYEYSDSTTTGQVQVDQSHTLHQPTYMHFLGVTDLLTSTCVR